MSGTASR